MSFMGLEGLFNFPQWRQLARSVGPITQDEEDREHRACVTVCRSCRKVPVCEEEEEDFLDKVGLPELHKSTTHKTFASLTPREEEQEFDEDTRSIGGKRFALNTAVQETCAKIKHVVCWHCGKKGHLSTECWSNPKNQPGSGGTQNRGGKGRHMQRSRIVGTRTTSCNGGARALSSALDSTSFETLVRSPHLDHEGWLRWTYDTGAAISAFPLYAQIGTETSGKLISHHVGLRVQGTIEYGYGVTFEGRKTDVHKTLL